MEAFYNFDTIKSFGVAPHYSRKMRWWQKKYRDISLKYNLFTIKNNIFLSVLGMIVQFAAFGYCLFRLWTHDITYGTMTLFLQQRANLSSAFNRMVSIIPSFLNSSVSAHRIRELVELPREVHIPESSGLDRYAAEGFEIRMGDVNFSYAQGKRVITDSSFRACPGGDRGPGRGPPERGKTTMIRLILGLVRPEEGQVSIRASDGTEVPMNAETRHLFAYVPQGNTITSGTIAENMRVGKGERHGRGDHRGPEDLLRLGFCERSAGDHPQQRGRKGQRPLGGPGPADRHCPGGAPGRSGASAGRGHIGPGRGHRAESPAEPGAAAAGKDLHRNDPTGPASSACARGVYRVMETRVTELDQEESSRMAMDFLTGRRLWKNEW